MIKLVQSGRSLIILVGLCSAIHANDPSERDRYGGWTGQTFESSGFFRLEKGGTPERWWLVTPEGHAFVIHGMDHCNLHTLWQPYNHEHWTREWGLNPESNEQERMEAFYTKKVAADQAYLG